MIARRLIERLRLCATLSGCACLVETAKYREAKPSVLRGMRLKSDARLGNVQPIKTKVILPIYRLKNSVFRGNITFDVVGFSSYMIR